MKLITILLGTAVAATILLTLSLGSFERSELSRLGEFNEFKKNFKKTY